jgi:hypothetical protein
LGFSDKLPTERAVFFCLSFSGKKNKRVETDARGEEREKAKKGSEREEEQALKAFCPPRHEFCQIFSRVLF